MDIINQLPIMISEKDKFIIYARKSTRPEDRQAQSLPDQLKELNDFAKSKQLDVIATYVESHSAFKGEREVFEKMVDFIKSRDDVKGLLIRDTDRGARNLTDADRLFKLIDQGYIDQIVTPNSIFDHSSFTHFSVKSIFDTEYSRTISTKVRASLKSRIERGIAPHDSLAGYMWNPKAVKGKKTHVPNPEQFELMKKLFSIFLTGKVSVAELTRTAESMGIKNCHDRPISRARMHYVLRDVFYTGRFMYQGQEYQGIHQRMLTDSQHKAVLKILEDRKHPCKPVAKVFAYNGLITCKECGMTYGGVSHWKHYKNGTSKEFRYYRCSKRGRIKCNQPYLSESNLELKVQDYLSSLSIGSDYTTWVYRWLKEMKSQEQANREASLKILNTDLNSINIKIDNLMDEKLSGSSFFTTEEIEEKYRALKIKRKEIEESIASVGSNSDIVNEMTLKTFVFAEKAKGLFETGTPEAKRKVLSTFGVDLSIYNKNLTIQPQIPFLMIQKAVNALNTQKGMCELDQTVTFEPSFNIPQSVKLAWRGLQDDVWTYWNLNKDENKEILRSNLNSLNSLFAYASIN